MSPFNANISSNENDPFNKFYKALQGLRTMWRGARSTGEKGEGGQMIKNTHAVSWACGPAALSPTRIDRSLGL